MKMKLKYYVQAGIAAVTVAMAGASCTDTWDDHFSAGSNVASGDLWNALKSSEDIHPFFRVLEACGYEKVLTSGQTFSVWAPDITEQEADKWIEAYHAANSKLPDENAAIHEFVRNHISLFNKQVSTLTDDTLVMMNGKRMRFSNGMFYDRLNNANGMTLKGEPMQFADGVLYKLNGESTFFSNILEQMQADSVGDDGLDSLVAFIRRFDRVEVDEDLSVPGGVVDGQTVYLDSVMQRSNDLLRSWGRIDSEDSLYWLVAPGNKVWREKTEEYSKYFVYHNDRAEDGDSLRNIYSKQMLTAATFFNVRSQPDKNFNPDDPDSICSTLYSSYSPGYWVYEQPFANGGILNGLQYKDCSNGRLYKSADWRINPESTTLMGTIRVEAENTNNYTTKPINENASKEQVEAIQADVIRVTDSKYPVSGGSCLQVRNVSGKNALYNEVSFLLRGVLSNCPYDIKVIFVPPFAFNDTVGVEQEVIDELKKPRQFKAMINYVQSVSGGMKTNPDNLPLGSGNTFFVVDAERMDTITVTGDKPMIFPVCNYGDGEEEARVKLTLQTKNKRQLDSGGYSGDLIIDKVILVPRPDLLREEEN